MSYTLDNLNYKFCKIKYLKFKLGMNYKLQIFEF